MNSVDHLIKQRPVFATMQPANITSALRNKPIELSHNIWMSPGPTPYIVLTQGHVDHENGWLKLQITKLEHKIQK